MSPLAYARRTISWAERRWSGSVVRMKRSGLIEEGILGGPEEGDLLVDEVARGAALLGRPHRDVDAVLVGARSGSGWAMPRIRCQRARASAAITSWSVWRPGLLFAYAMAVVT